VVHTVGLSDVFFYADLLSSWYWPMRSSRTPEREIIRRAVAATLKYLRYEARIAQEDVAYESGLERAYMSGLERGLHTPSIETIYKLLPALNITFIEFAQEFEKQLQRIQRPRH
jgi:DNA-binding XRE family transcriptional regulator